MVTLYPCFWRNGAVNAHSPLLMIYLQVACLAILQKKQTLYILTYFSPFPIPSLSQQSGPTRLHDLQKDQIHLLILS